MGGGGNRDGVNFHRCVGRDAINVLAVLRGLIPSAFRSKCRRSCSSGRSFPAFTRVASCRPFLRIRHLMTSKKVTVFHSPMFWTIWDDWGSLLRYREQYGQSSSIRSSNLLLLLLFT